VTDEVHQHFVEGRHGSPLDVALDGVGVAIGILVFRRLVQPRVASDARQVS
jgi:VanZ family protein